MTTSTVPNIYQFSAKLVNGVEKSLADFSNKVLLIVNTASSCGFTPQYQELQQIWEEFSPAGFEVLAFPSNDFGRQEPLNGQEISEFCLNKYNVLFPIFEKTLVRGHLAHPLFKFLADKKLNGKLNSTPRWNFHKYLINRRGELVEFFYPFTKPSSAKVKKKISRLLNEAI